MDGIKCFDLRVCDGELSCSRTSRQPACSQPCARLVIHLSRTRAREVCCRYVAECVAVCVAVCVVEGVLQCVWCCSEIPLFAIVL